MEMLDKTLSVLPVGCRMGVNLLKIWIDYPDVKIDVYKSYEQAGLYVRAQLPLIYCSALNDPLIRMLGSS